MAIFTIAAGQTLRMDNMTFPVGVYASGDGSIRIQWPAQGTPNFQVVSPALAFTPPNGEPIYPRTPSVSGYIYEIGDIVFDMDFFDPAFGSGPVGTLAGIVWTDVLLYERIDVIEGATVYTYQFLAPQLNIFYGDDTVTLGDGDDYFLDNGGSLQASLGAGDDFCGIYQQGSNSSAIKYVDAGAGNDVIEYQSGNGTILGGAGNDSIDRAGSNDGVWMFEGGRGQDTINANPGGRIVDRNGSGNDYYSALSNFEVTVSYATAGAAISVNNHLGTVTGARTGQDTVVGGIFTYEGTRYDDTMVTVLGVTFLGRGGNDTLSGGFADDSLDGGAGDDVLTGNGAADTLQGGDGNDLVAGGTGDDLLNGGGGDDTLTGGQGADRTNGGAGADVFVFLDDSDSTVAVEGRDRIAGFSAAEDVIDLSALGALTFVGTGPFTGAGQVRYVQTDTNTFVSVNLSGVDTAEMRINILGLHVLTEANFDL